MPPLSGLCDLGVEFSAGRSLYYHPSCPMTLIDEFCAPVSRFGGVGPDGGRKKTRGGEAAGLGGGGWPGLLREARHVVHQVVDFRGGRGPVAVEQLGQAVVGVVEEAVGLVVG